jgi:hypothetical protein
MAAKSEKNTQNPITVTDENAKTKIRWDVAKMQTSYANVCNVSSTHEEFTLLFGINKTWNAEQRELTVDISDRIILNPYAAKRLAMLLHNVVSQHEGRFGEIKLESPENSSETV